MKNFISNSFKDIINPSFTYSCLKNAQKVSQELKRLDDLYDRVSNSEYHAKLKELVKEKQELEEQEKNKANISRLKKLNKHIESLEDGVDSLNQICELIEVRQHHIFNISYSELNGKKSNLSSLEVVSDENEVGLQL